MSAHPEHILLNTDIGSDIDDHEAFVVVEGATRKNQFKLHGTITSTMVPHLRARIAESFYRDWKRSIPIAEGSTYPLGRDGDDSLWHAYIFDRVLNTTSERRVRMDRLDAGDSIKFRDPTELLLTAIRESKQQLNLVVICPMTDIAKALLHDIGSVKKGLKRLVFMGGVHKTRKRNLEPDHDSYNVKGDPWAAEIVLSKLQEHVPMTFVHKSTAYQIPLSRRDFQDFENTQHSVGEELREHCELCLRAFAESGPSKFSELYHAGNTFDANDPIRGVTHYSNPYDPTAVLALLRPELFNAEEVGHHRIIGSPKSGGAKNPATLKRVLKRYMMDALK